MKQRGEFCEYCVPGNHKIAQVWFVTGNVE